ncbi:MAG: 50S ribosomal protein L18 [Candidatus Diapherotrites archaeon]|nr:50S ribosomal protein L18 [Candidatus Diapherotrites archaeon]
MQRIKRKFKRRLKGKTNYAKRIKTVTSKRTRFVVRKSLNHITVQCINYEETGDKTVIGVNSKALSKFKWKAHGGNASAAYLTGLLCASKAKTKGIKEGILDIGLATPTKKSVVYAALKGVIDGGVTIPYSKEVLPSENVINGKATAEYAQKLEKPKYEKQFSGYLKVGLKPEDLPKNFEESKTAILGGK